ncbi:MAG: YjfB family protein [Syntrophomonas sp.]|nr:YjfB family protein [Syntrophomonas sp.]
METSAIAGMVMGAQAAQLQQSVSLGVMKMSMDNTSDTGQALLDMMKASTQAMERSITPHLGVNLDVLA